VLDGRNNVVAVTDSSGKVVNSYAYDSWGEPLTDLTKQQAPQQYRYGSYWLDDAVGWYWVRIRYYDPEWPPLHCPIQLVLPPPIRLAVVYMRSFAAINRRGAGPT
jgi:hypothetical protein